MALKDHIKGFCSPVSQNNTPRNSRNSLSIKSNDIHTILWYLRIRRADDKSIRTN